MIGVPSRNGHGPDGWYDLSTVVGGRLHPFIRCEHRAGWCGDVLSVAWARDGTRLAFSVTSVGGTAEFNGVHIITLRTRRDFWTPIRSGDLGPENLEWSPDGSKLVFDSSGSLYVLGVKGFRVTRVHTGTSDGSFDYSPSWSADGRRLVFATKHQKNSSISVINIDGSHRRLLARDASFPSWSPDGKTIAYRTSCGIKLTTPRGLDVTPANPPFVCHAIGLAGQPIWTPDGNKLAILGAPSFTPATFIMDADGRHLRVLTHATGRTFSPAGRGDASWQPQP
jgi:Tol biopolymer transport system component